MNGIRSNLPLASTFGVVLLLCGGALASQKPEVPVVEGRVGACSATFTVLDSAGRPIYDAKINVVIHYGFLSLHKTELEVGTNSEGKARVAGLPDKVKKPLEFLIMKDGLSKTVSFDPSAKCNALVEVTLGTQ